LAHKCRPDRVATSFRSRSRICRQTEKGETDFVTDPAALLSRLQSDRAEVIDARRFLLRRHLLDADLAPWTRPAKPKDEVSIGDAALVVCATSGECAQVRRNGDPMRNLIATVDATPAGDGEGFGGDGIALLRAISARTEQVEARLESMQARLTEARSQLDEWTGATVCEEVSRRVVAESRVEGGISDVMAERRRAEIISEARSQVRALLAAAERAADVIATGAPDPTLVAVAGPSHGQARFTPASRRQLTPGSVMRRTCTR
jgi:hypothetical protein